MRSIFTIQRFRPYIWIALIYFIVLLMNDMANHQDHFGFRMINHVWRIGYLTLLNFIFFEYTIENFNRKTVIRSILLIIVHIMLYSWGLYWWRLLGINLHIYTSLVNFPNRGKAVTEQMTASMMSLLFFTIARHIYNFFRLKQAAQQLRIEKQQAELSYLKSQTNPHFLFNTLNNIYSLSRSKSDLAPESIMRLSKILRFMLYETTGDYISVEKELKIITDYIELEKLRYDESFQLNFNYDIEDKNQSLPPLLLMPLVENAFKHGVSETRFRPYIDIHLAIKNRQLQFVVKNSSDTADTDMVKENIGLSNLRRQLELLYTDYKLSVNQEQGDFCAQLKINLASHV